MLQYLGGGVAHLEEHLIKRAVFDIAINQTAELLGIAKRREWTVNQTDDFAEMDFRRRPPQLVTALGPAHAFHDARVLQFEQDQLEELFRKPLFISNVADADGALVVMA